MVGWKQGGICLQIVATMAFLKDLSKAVVKKQKNKAVIT